MKRNLALVHFESELVDCEPAEEYACEAAVAVPNGLRLCAARNCGARAASDSPYCGECCAEIESLQQMEVERAWKRQERLERLGRMLESWLVFWGWLRNSEMVNWLLAIFVAIGLGYWFATWGGAIVAWLKQCAGVQ